MKKILLFASILLVFASCQPAKESTNNDVIITVQNTLDFDRTDETIVVSTDQLGLTLATDEVFEVYDAEKAIPSQLVTEGPKKGLMILVDDIASGALKELAVKKIHKDSAKVFPKRTQAELSIKEGGEWKGREYLDGSFKNVESLRVPDEHTDHSWYIRYEGPGWESDKVGYRFYLDWRNATDVFGKTTADMVLQDVGQDGFDSYHELSDWGMDVLKVGKSLGIGSPAYFNNDMAVRIDSTDSIYSEILVNGSIYSAIKTQYFGWEVADKKLDINSFYSIHAGSRLTHHHMEYAGETDNLATGIGKSEKAELFINKGSATAYGYIATYGQQSLNDDKLGLAVLCDSSQIKEITQDEYSDVLVMKPVNQSVDYYFLAAWELEKEGVTNQEDFLAYVQQTAQRLASPLIVEVKQQKN